jgi:hypothetical protein
MRARHRHFSHKAAGAVVAYDARYLDNSDGTALQTWPNRASTSYDATESDAAKRPVVKTGANGINGQTALDFDGSNDDLQAASVPLNTFITVIVCGQFTTAKPFFFEHSADTTPSSGFYFYGSNGNSWEFCRSSSAHEATGSSAWFGSSAAVASLTYNGSGAYRRNGGSQISNGSVLGTARTNSSVTDNFNICSRNRASVFGDGLLGCLAVYDGAAADPLRKRLEHAAAYSFKIACN